MCWCLRPSRPRGDKGADAVGPQHPCVAVVLCFWAPGDRPGGRDRRVGGALEACKRLPSPEEGMEDWPRNAQGLPCRPGWTPTPPRYDLFLPSEALRWSGLGGRGGVAGRCGVAGPTLGRMRRWGIGAASREASGQPGKPGTYADFMSHRPLRPRTEAKLPSRLCARLLRDLRGAGTARPCGGCSSRRRWAVRAGLGFPAGCAAAGGCRRGSPAGSGGCSGCGTAADERAGRDAGPPPPPPQSLSAGRAAHPPLPPVPASSRPPP